MIYIYRALFYILFNRIAEYMCDVDFQFTQSHMLSNLDIQLLNPRKAIHKSSFNRPESFYKQYESIILFASAELSQNKEDN